MVHQRAAILMMFMRALPLVFGTAVFASAACTDFPTPAELTKPTVLAIVADPPLVHTGDGSDLTVVLAGPDGPMAPEVVEWTLVETLPGVTPFGTVEAVGSAGARYTAPDPVPPQPDDAPPIATVQATVTAGEETIVVVKGMLVADVPSANPTISALTIGGQVVEGEEVTLTRGETAALEVGTDPVAGDDAFYAWYATAGTIEQYQSNPCEIAVTDEAPDSGWIFAVVRDGRGGVAWRGLHATVESP